MTKPTKEEIAELGRRSEEQQQRTAELFRQARNGQMSWHQVADAIHAMAAEFRDMEEVLDRAVESVLGKREPRAMSPEAQEELMARVREGQAQFERGDFDARKFLVTVYGETMADDRDMIDMLQGLLEEEAKEERAPSKDLPGD